MANKRYDKSEGVWRTIGGRRVFIRTGQSLSDAMKESGKFKKASDISRNEYHTLKDEFALEDKIKEKIKNDPEYKNLDYDKETYELDRRLEARYNSTEAKDLSGLEGKHIAKETPMQEEARLENERIKSIKNEEKANRRLSKEYNKKQEENDRISKGMTKKEYKDDKYSFEKEKAEYELYKRAKENPDSIDPMTENSTDWEALDKKYKDRYEKEYWQNAKEAYDIRQREGLDKFIQKTDMYGGEVEYTKEDLKRMEEAGTRPMAHSYTGGGWEGTNYDSKLTTKEIGKRVTDEMKKQFPDVKISRRGDNYSMGSSIDFNIMESEKDLFVSDKDIDNMTDFGRLSVGIGFENWAEKNVEGFKRYTNEVYTTDDVRRYAKEALSNIKSHEDQNVRGDEWYLSDYGKKVISELNKQADSYTYSDNDGMVDYFDHGTYMHISIGKWNKPYQVSTSKSVKSAYEKYLNEHQDSNISLEEFKKWFK